MEEDIDQQFLVVDASVILAAILPQEAYARIALTFIKRITTDGARTIHSAYKIIEPTYVDFSILSESALKVALSSKTSIYDAAYAALAQERGCSMCTLDKKLIQKLKVLPVHVTYLGDFG